MTKSEIYYISNGYKEIGQKQCKYCNQQFKIYLKRDLNRKNFCSRNCASKFTSNKLQTGDYLIEYYKKYPKIKPIEKFCKFCNKKISQQSKKNLCLICFNKNRINIIKIKKRIEFFCNYCNKLNSQKENQYKKSKRHFCNKICLQKYKLKNSKKKKYICPQCNKEFLRFPCLVEVKNPFCSKVCRSIYHGIKRRKTCNFYIDGRTPLRKLIKRSYMYENWQKSIYIKNNYKCIKCQSNQKIHAHHIIHFKKLLDDFLNKYKNLDPIKNKNELLELSYRYEPFWSVNNGEVLCKKCHQLEHPDINFNKKIMPLPTPTTNEKKDKNGQNLFISRCMEIQKDEQLPQDQKLARCFSQYRRAKSRKQSKGDFSEPTWEECNCCQEKVDIFY